MSDTDPKLLSRKAVIECYETLSNPTPEYHKALLWELTEHIDAQGRLLAAAGNYIHKQRDPAMADVLREIGRAILR